MMIHAHHTRTTQDNQFSSCGFVDRTLLYFLPTFLLDFSEERLNGGAYTASPKLFQCCKARRDCAGTRNVLVQMGGSGTRPALILACHFSSVRREDAGCSNS